jgi:outer membrane protein assembly factor BamB
MKRVLFLIIPVVLLIVFYLATKKKELHNEFNRILVSNVAITTLDTIFQSKNAEIDGIKIDKNHLWLNRRFSIVKCATDGKVQEEIKAFITSTQNPIINFYVGGDSVFYYQANIKQINLFNLQLNKHVTPLKFNFNISYFSKGQDKTFLFQETNENGSDQIRTVNFENNKDSINQSVLSREENTGIQNSGIWFASVNFKDNYFVMTHDDFLFCFDRSGGLKYKLKTIDFQNQNLKIIIENNRISLSPEVSVLRNGACVFDQNLFVSSYVRENKQNVKDFNNNLTIDVYRADNGKYKFSFYLPNFSNQRAYSFAIADNKMLYALYGNTIIVYNLAKFLNDEK